MIAIPRIITTVFIFFRKCLFLFFKNRTLICPADEDPELEQIDRVITPDCKEQTSLIIIKDRKKIF